MDYSVLESKSLLVLGVITRSDLTDCRALHVLNETDPLPNHSREGESGQTGCCWFAITMVARLGKASMPLTTCTHALQIAIALNY